MASLWVGASGAGGASRNVIESSASATASRNSDRTSFSGVISSTTLVFEAAPHLVVDVPERTPQVLPEVIGTVLLDQELGDLLGVPDAPVDMVGGRGRDVFGEGRDEFGIDARVVSGAFGESTVLRQNLWREHHVLTGVERYIISSRLGRSSSCALTTSSTIL